MKKEMKGHLIFSANTYCKYANAAKVMELSGRQRLKETGAFESRLWVMAVGVR